MSAGTRTAGRRRATAVALVVTGQLLSTGAAFWLAFEAAQARFCFAFGSTVLCPAAWDSVRLSIMVSLVVIGLGLTAIGLWHLSKPREEPEEPEAHSSM